MRKALDMDYQLGEALEGLRQQEIKTVLEHDVQRTIRLSRAAVLPCVVHGAERLPEGSDVGGSRVAAYI